MRENLEKIYVSDIISDIIFVPKLIIVADEENVFCYQQRIFLTSSLTLNQQKNQECSFFGIGASLAFKASFRVWSFYSLSEALKNPTSANSTGSFAFTMVNLAFVAVTAGKRNKRLYPMVVN